MALWIFKNHFSYKSVQILKKKHKRNDRFHVTDHSALTSRSILYSKLSLVHVICIGHPIATIPSNPCIPTPCGPNSNCHVVNELSVCSCLPNYIGRAPNCRPECMTNSECARNLACVNERCIDPCIGTCGAYATCIVYNHQAVCRCPDEFTGDPFSTCSPIPSKCLLFDWWEYASMASQMFTKACILFWVLFSDQLKKKIQLFICLLANCKYLRTKCLLFPKSSDPQSTQQCLIRINSQYSSLSRARNYRTMQSVTMRCKCCMQSTQ